MAASRSPLSQSSAAETAPWSCSWSLSFPLGRGRGQHVRCRARPAGPPALSEGTSAIPSGSGRAHEAGTEQQKGHVSPLGPVPCPYSNPESHLLGEGRFQPTVDAGLGPRPLCLPAPHVQPCKSPCKSEHCVHSRLPAGELGTRSCFQMRSYCCFVKLFRSRSVCLCLRPFSETTT